MSIFSFFFFLSISEKNHPRFLLNVMTSKANIGRMLFDQKSPWHPGKFWKKKKPFTQKNHQKNALHQKAEQVDKGRNNHFNVNLCVLTLCYSLKTLTHNPHIYIDSLSSIGWCIFLQSYTDLEEEKNLTTTDRYRFV